MKIESLIKRKGGTLVEMDAPKRSYRFQPEDGVHESPHVADVDVDSHAKQFLRIREGFRLAEGEEGPKQAHKDDNEPHEKLNGSNVHSAVYPIKGGETIELNDLVEMAFSDSGLEYEDWQELADQERYDYINATLQELQLGEGELDDEEQPHQPPAQPLPAPLPVSEQQPAPENDGKREDGQREDGQLGAGEQKPGATDEKKPEQNLEQNPKSDAPSMDMSRDDLAALFKKRFGREPSRQLNKADIINALSEED